jgi:hypothetical protein
MKNFIRKPFTVFLIIISFLFIFNNSNNKVPEKSSILDFDPNSTVIVPNYRQLFLRHYESKYKVNYSKDNTINSQSK